MFAGPWLVKRRFVAVKLGDDEVGELTSDQSIKNGETSYRLQLGDIDHTWKSLVSGWTNSLEIEPGLLFQIGETETGVLRYKGEIRPFHLVERSGLRRATFEQSEFLHRDFRSEIEFRCPRHHLIRTIILAHLLFEPPVNQQMQ